MTLTLAYSFLRYTIGFCQEKNYPPDYAMVKEEVFQLIEHVLPPEFNGDLCLNNITELWTTEKAKQENRANSCQKGGPHNNCALAFTGGTHPTKELLDKYLEPFIPEAGMSGWETHHEGRLVATKQGAFIRLRWKPFPDMANWKVQIFSVYKDSAAIPSSLQWELSAPIRKRRSLQEHHYNNYTVARRRSLQEEILAEVVNSGTIEGTHDSSSTMVLPTSISVDEKLLASEVELKLELVEGDSFEIVAMMVCFED